MGQESLTLQLLASGLNSIVLARYSLMDVVCFYDWIISLDQEVALIYPAPWNVVKCAYLFCRYYPMAIAPSTSGQQVCEPYYHALYACTIPTTLSAQFILMLRTYAFSGRKKSVLAVLSITLLVLVGVIIWVMSEHLALPLLFVIERTGCFAISDLPTFDLVPAANQAQVVGAVQVPLAYHMGILSTFFDCLNMFIVVLHCIQRGTLGPLGQSFLKQGTLVYVVMTALNALTIVTFLSSYLVEEGLGSSVWLAYILPSALVIIFLSPASVLTLRQKASPTATELRVVHSHMVNEALEMVDMEWRSEKTSEGFVPATSTDSRAQP
ncbi:hypothetical protein EI94DRAFT_1715438 [Lactarius quietus]|nr:hypothetical protein EI94DRAFT_1715438 [Lactarius quietus]